jgi:putative redox protein
MTWRLLDGPVGVLRCYTTAEPPPDRPLRRLLVCHELPQGRSSASEIGRTLPVLADQLCRESGWQVVTATLRGAGGSDGDFSAAGWLQDLRFILDGEIGPTGSAWLAGFGIGAVLALDLAASDERVRGVVAMGASDDLSAWAAEPSDALEECRRSGVIRRRRFPRDLRAWAAELAQLQPLRAAHAIGDRPLLVVHGADDKQVAPAAAHAIAAAHGHADLRIVAGAGQWLRADPRVVATLIGWLERQR